MDNGMSFLLKKTYIFGSKPNNFVIYGYKEFFRVNNKKTNNYIDQQLRTAYQ